jgi:tripartite-type tricarboxylate transporter receptor subunit TctC
MKNISLPLAFVGLSTLVAFSPPAIAQTETSSGKPISLIVGFSPGGGYDLYARLAADHYGRHLPGAPKILVQNMPGGGGRRSIVHLAGNAPRDGTMIGMLPQAVALDALLGEMPANVNVATLEPIGRMTDNIELQVTWHTSPTKTFADAQKRETTTAATGAAGISSFVPRVTNLLLGTKFKVIDGYRGSADMVLAVERGEAEGMVQTWPDLKSNNRRLLDQKQLNLVWQISINRHPELPNVPALVEFAQSSLQKGALQAIAGTAEVGRSLAAPGGVSEERMKILRNGFEKMVKDQAFLDDATKRNLPISPASSDQLKTWIAQTMATPKEAIEPLKTALAESSK